MAVKMAHLAMGNMPEEADAAGARPNPQSEGGGPVPQGSEHTYPPGASYQVGPEEMGKMGVHKQHKVGDHVHFEGHGVVKKIHSHTGSDGTPQHTMHVQMTHLGHHRNAKSAAQKMYGGKETAAEEKAEAKSGKY